MFNREAASNFAQGQMGFIDFVGLKHFQTIGKWNPKLQFLADNVQRNRDAWEALSKET